MPANPNKSQVVSGAYKANYEGLDMGLSQAGFTLSQRTMGQSITSDITGDAEVDHLWQGVQMSVSFVLNNWNAEAVQHLLWWFGDTLSDTDLAAGKPGKQIRERGRYGSVQRVGLSAWEYARPLELVSCQLETPDYINMDDDTAYDNLATISPEAIIFPKAILRKDDNYDLLFSSKARFVPLTLDILPVNFIETPADIIASTFTRPVGCSRMTYFVCQFPVNGEPTAP
jgi:hypothetical protein